MILQKKIKNKKISNIDDIDVNKILVCRKETYGKYNYLKNFIGYNDNDVIRPLCSRLSKMTGFINKFKENKKTSGYPRKSKENTTMSLTVNDEQLFKKYNKIWKKVEKLMISDFESKPFYGNEDDDDDYDDDKYVKTKVRIYGYSIIGDFLNKKVLKEKATCKCLSIIMLDSVIEVDKKYYPQTFLEECKYVPEKIKFENYINENLDSDSDDENNDDNDNDSDKE